MLKLAIPERLTPHPRLSLISEGFQPEATKSLSGGSDSACFKWPELDIANLDSQDADAIRKKLASIFGSDDLAQVRGHIRNPERSFYGKVLSGGIPAITYFCSFNSSGAEEGALGQACAYLHLSNWEISPETFDDTMRNTGGRLIWAPKGVFYLSVDAHYPGQTYRIGELFSEYRFSCYESPYDNSPGVMFLEAKDQKHHPELPHLVFRRALQKWADSAGGIESQNKTDGPNPLDKVIIDSFFYPDKNHTARNYWPTP